MKHVLATTARLGWLALALATVSADALAEPHAPASAVDKAEAYAANAYDAYQRKDYTTAVTLYRQAYETAPTADILFNIARIYDIGLGDRAMAMLFYQDYVVDPEAEDARIEVAFERIGQLQAAERSAREPRGSSGSPACGTGPPSATGRADPLRY